MLRAMAANARFALHGTGGERGGGGGGADDKLSSSVAKAVCLRVWKQVKDGRLCLA